MLHSDYALRRQIDRLVRNMHDLQDHPVYNQPNQPYRMDSTTVLCVASDLAELQQIIRDTIVNIELLEMNRPAKKRTNLFRRIFRKK